MFSFYYNKIDKFNLIWLHIPKNCSTTVRNWLNKTHGYQDFNDMPNHVWRNKFNNKIKNIQEFKQSNYKKILTLRNPYYRFVSSFIDKFIAGNEILPPARQMMTHLDIYRNPYDVTFEHFVNKLYQHPNTLYYDQHWVAQSIFINGLELNDFDYILQVSNFTKQFNNMCEKEGWPKLTENKRVIKYHDIPDKQNLSQVSVGELRRNYQIPKKDYFLNAYNKMLIKSVYTQDFRLYEEAFNEQL